MLSLHTFSQTLYLSLCVCLSCQSCPPLSHFLKIPLIHLYIFLFPMHSIFFFFFSLYLSVWYIFSLSLSLQFFSCEKLSTPPPFRGTYFTENSFKPLFKKKKKKSKFTNLFLNIKLLTGVYKGGIECRSLNTEGYNQGRTYTYIFKVFLGEVSFYSLLFSHNPPPPFACGGDAYHTRSPNEFSQ